MTLTTIIIIDGDRCAAAAAGTTISYDLGGVRHIPSGTPGNAPLEGIRANCTSVEG